jgi:hypothetical protein
MILPNYEGATRYTSQLTMKENLFCEAIVIDELTPNEAFFKVYPESVSFSKPVLYSRVQKMTQKEKIKKRIEELEEVKKAKNQTRDEFVKTFENNKREYMLHQFIDFIKRCKQSDDRGNELKGLEAIAKLYNLYSDGNITNNQLNQIIIQAPDVNKAIESITGLVNTKQISQK